MPFFIAWACARRSTNRDAFHSLKEETKRRIRSGSQQHQRSLQERAPVSGIYRGHYVEADGIRRQVRFHLSFKRANIDEEQAFYSGGYEIDGHSEYDNGIKPKVMEGFLSSDDGQVCWIEEGPSSLLHQPKREVLTSGTWNCQNRTFAGAWSSSPLGRFHFDNERAGSPPSPLGYETGGAYSLSLVTALEPSPVVARNDPACRSPDGILDEQASEYHLVEQDDDARVV